MGRFGVQRTLVPAPSTSALPFCLNETLAFFFTCSSSLPYLLSFCFSVLMCPRLRGALILLLAPPKCRERQACAIVPCFHWVITQDKHLVF